MKKPYDDKYYDKDEFHQGNTPAETLISLHCSEVIMKLLERLSKEDLDALITVVNSLLRTHQDQNKAIDYLKRKCFELEKHTPPTDYDKSKIDRESTATPHSSPNAVWERDKYGNVVKNP